MGIVGSKKIYFKAADSLAEAMVQAQSFIAECSTIEKAKEFVDLSLYDSPAAKMSYDSIPKNVMECWLQKAMTFDFVFWPKQKVMALASLKQFYNSKVFPKCVNFSYLAKNETPMCSWKNISPYFDNIVSKWEEVSERVKVPAKVGIFEEVRKDLLIDKLDEKTICADYVPFSLSVPMSDCLRDELLQFAKNQLNMSGVTEDLKNREKEKERKYIKTRAALGDEVYFIEKKWKKTVLGRYTMTGEDMVYSGRLIGAKTELVGPGNEVKKEYIVLCSGTLNGAEKDFTTCVPSENLYVDKFYAESLLICSVD